MGASESAVGQAQRARRALAVALVLFRWAALAWMAVLAITTRATLARPGVAWAAVGVAAAWTVFAAANTRTLRVSAWIELALALGLILVSGFVVADGAVVAGRPFFAASWPMAAVAAVAISRGPLGGVAAAVFVSVALLGARIVNGVGPADMTAVHWQGFANGAMTYLLAGGAIGLVSRLLDRSAAEYQVAIDEAMVARERAARLAERESLARQIHDSVLQALALVHKRGKELAATAGPEVGALADMAGEQEAALRSLILRAPEEVPSGTASLRHELEQVARAVVGLDVRVTAVGPVLVPAGWASELAAAAKQALDNVVEHAGASTATVFAEEDEGVVVVSIRDDGHGFTYDEEQLEADGKAGLLRSMKGRVMDLGGRMVVDSSPRGTEIEFRVPRVSVEG